MCIFTEPVKWVGDTEIFACSTGPRRQGLIYSMSYASEQPLAMVLPVPVPLDVAEDDIRFLDFEDFGGVFKQIRLTFSQDRGGRDSYDDHGRGGGESRKLAVHRVGSFDASFVPKRSDFDRLDERFRLSEKVWKRLEGYADYGFVVWILRDGEWNTHPMAFAFTRRDPDRLYFPTVHVHDDKVHALARFDHVLYSQEAERTGLRWRRSRSSAKSAAIPGMPTPPLVRFDEDSHFYRRRIRGLRPNRDVWLRCSHPGAYGVEGD